MSNYEEEQGDILLPSTAVAPLRSALRAYCNALHDQVLARSKELHKSFQTRSIKKYSESLSKAREKHYQQTSRRRPAYGSGWRVNAFGRNAHHRAPLRPELLVAKDAVEELSLKVLSNILDQARYGNGAIHVPTIKDVALFATKATTRTNVFHEGEAIIAFNGRTVTWAVNNNNHAVDNARGTKLAELFFGQLEAMKWTAKTGGVILYNTEYDHDDRSAYSFGSTISSHFGPVGEKTVEARDKAMLAMAGL